MGSSSTCSASSPTSASFPTFTGLRSGGAASPRARASRSATRRASAASAAAARSASFAFQPDTVVSKYRARASSGVQVVSAFSVEYVVSFHEMGAGTSPLASTAKAHRSGASLASKTRYDSPSVASAAAAGTVSVAYAFQRRSSSPCRCPWCPPLRYSACFVSQPSSGRTSTALNPQGTEHSRWNDRRQGFLTATRNRHTVSA